MTQVWFVYYNVKSLYVKTLTLAMFKILHNIYIDRFLLVAFIKNIFYHRSAAMYFWILSGDCGNCCFLKKIFLKSSHIYLFFIQEPVTSITHEWLVVESYPTSQWVTILVFYRLFSFTWPHFGLKCSRVTIMPKGQSLELKASVLYETFPILKQAGIVIHFLNLKIVTE